MNLIAKLIDLVASYPQIEEAVDRLAAEIRSSQRERPQLERSLDVLRQAFRKHVETLGGPIPRLVCAFCKKTDQEVAKIVAASDVAICDECVALCNDVIEERIQPGAGATSPVARVMTMLRRRITRR